MAAGRVPESTPTAPLTLTTLGGANLAAGTDILLGPGKPLALVTYLALAPGRAATREFLLDLLWADLDHERARHALRQTVWQLRQLLGEAILTGRAELKLGLDIESDRDRFLAAIEAGDPDTAVALYRGDFLPDFALPGSTEFEHWAAISAGRFREAQQLARRMRDTDRLNETGWRLLLEALIAGRDLLQAGIDAEALRAVLAAEGREPEPATSGLLAVLRRAQGEAVAPAGGAAQPLLAELVGREREFAAILEAWGQARRGQCRHLHLSAPAGLGKTRLLTDLAHRLRSTGGRVVTLRANPGDRAVAYALAGDLAGALGGLPGLPAVSPGAAEVLVGLNPSLTSRFPAAHPPRAGGDELLRLRTAALAEAVSAVADEHPLALLLDDAHWLDADSSRVVQGLIHRLDRAPVLVVTAGRPGVGRAIAGPGTVEIELEPLREAEVAGLFVSLGRLADEALRAAVTERLFRASEGSPLLALEALQLALDRGTLRLADGAWSVPDPEALLAELARGNALGSRLAGLDPDAAWLLLVMATAGTPLGAGELAGTMRARERLEEQLWALERKGLARRAGTSWEVAHDELAATALERESEERRRAARIAVGRLLLEQSAHALEPALQAARHFAEAGDDHGLRLAYRAAVRLARQAGDGRGNLALARTVTRDEARAAALVRSLPLRNRLGLHSRARLAAAALVLLASAAAALALAAPGASEPAEARLLLLHRNAADTSVVEVTEVDLSRRGWQPGKPIRPPAPDRRIRDPVLARLGGHRFDVSPDGTSWAFNAFVDNLRTDDVFVRRNGTSRVLLPAPRDDGAPTWSPDGESLVLTTSRWSAARADDEDLAVVDMATGVARRLTATNDFILRGLPTAASSRSPDSPVRFDPAKPAGSRRTAVASIACRLRSARSSTSSAGSTASACCSRWPRETCSGCFAGALPTIGSSGCRWR